MLHRWSIWTLGFLVILAGLALPAQVIAAKGGTDRPFKGSAVGMITGAPAPNELIIDWTGNATHLGAFTRREFLTINPDGTIHGTMVFTAANGDELWLDFEGAFTSATTAEGAYTFTGGTGRFEDATGEAAFQARILADGSLEAKFKGTISY